MLQRVWFLCCQILWPNGEFFISLRSTPGEVDDGAQPGERSVNMTGKFGGSKGSKPGSFELQLEASRRASYIKKMLFGNVSFLFKYLRILCCQLIIIS